MGVGGCACGMQGVGVGGDSEKCNASLGCARIVVEGFGALKCFFSFLFNFFYYDYYDH